MRFHPSVIDQSQRWFWRGRACGGVSRVGVGELPVRLLVGSVSSETPQLDRAYDVPDSVVRGVHADDVLREAEHPLAELVLCHDGAQVAHGLAVLLRVCDGSERMQAAVILGKWLNVRPCLVVVVVFRHSFPDAFCLGVGGICARR